MKPNEFYLFETVEYPFMMLNDVYFSTGLFLLDLFYRSVCSHRSPSAVDSKRVTAMQYFYHVLTSGNSALLLPTTANQLPSSSANEKAGSSSSGPATLSRMSLEDFRVFLWAALKLGVIMAYFYVCDRTNFFMKENK